MEGWSNNWVPRILWTCLGLWKGQGGLKNYIILYCKAASLFNLSLCSLFICIIRQDYSFTRIQKSLITTHQHSFFSSVGSSQILNQITEFTKKTEMILIWCSYGPGAFNFKQGAWPFTCIIDTSWKLFETFILMVQTDTLGRSQNELRRRALHSGELLWSSLKNQVDHL